MASLGAVTLPDDTFWEDEFGWTAIDSAKRYTLGGRLKVEHFNKNQGRNITLSVLWITLAQLRSLEAMRDEAYGINTYTAPNGSSYQTKFRHEDSAPLEVTPVVNRPNYEVCPDESYFDVKIKLIQI
jgi:hypothetical protein